MKKLKGLGPDELEAMADRLDSIYLHPVRLSLFVVMVL